MPVPHPLRPYPPLIVNVALTGMIPRRAQVPQVPVTAEAIVEDAVACQAAGAAIVHLHAPHRVRGPDLAPRGLTAPARADTLAQLVRELPEGTVWAAAGLGGFQLPANGLAIFMGGHARTGLEDNPWWDHATREPVTNAGLVHRVAALAELAGRRLATPDEARERLGLALVPSA